MTFPRTLLMVLVLGILTFVPTMAFAADATFFGPIIPQECHCDGSAPDWGCVMQVLQNGINFMVSLGIIIFMLSIAYAGALYMGSAGNPVKHGQAVDMMKNTVLGILVLVSAWLLVDFVMGVLYNPGAARFGPWEAILQEGDPRICLEKTTPPAAQALAQFSAGNTVTCTFESGAEHVGTVTSIKDTLPDGRQLLVIQFPPDAQGNPNVVDGMLSTECRLGGSTTGGGEEPPPSTGTGPNCPAADPSSMVAFPAAATSGETESATPATVERFMAMRAAAAEDGIDLKVTDGFRSDAEQVQLWNQNGCADGSCDRATAKPCSLGGTGSNHNSGQAIDISVGCQNGQSNCNTPAYNWLKQNGAQWSFRNSLPSDPVHWSPTGR